MDKKIPRFTALLAALSLLAIPSSAEKPKRVVSLLPSHTEIVLALGLEKCLAGVSDAESASVLPDLPRVGGLIPNWEALAALKPDLVLADVSHRRYQINFERLNIAALYLPATRARTIEDVFALIQEVGDGMAVPERARSFVQKQEEYLRRLDLRPSRRKGRESPRVFFEIWPKPLQAAAPGSLQGNLLVRAGARNIVPDLGNEMPLISPEWVVKEAPEVIFHTGIVSGREISRRPGWRDVPAVKNRRIVQVDRDLFSRAGPRIGEALKTLMDVLDGENP